MYFFTFERNKIKTIDYMKKNLFFLVLSLSLLASPIYASFPISKEKAQTEVKSELIIDAQDLELSQELSNADLASFADESSDDDEDRMSRKEEEMLITVLLWFFLGWAAAHRWYKKKPVGWNILYILTGGGCGIWAIVDLVNILTGKF